MEIIANKSKQQWKKYILMVISNLMFQFLIFSKLYYELKDCGYIIHCSTSNVELPFWCGCHRVNEMVRCAWVTRRIAGV